MKNNNVFYSCPYCKEEYSEPGDLARCILSCEEKKRIEEEAKKRAKLEAEKEARKTEIEETEKKLIELKSSYVKDYGHYYTTRKYDPDTIPSILHWLL